MFGPPAQCALRHPPSQPLLVLPSPEDSRYSQHPSAHTSPRRHTGRTPEGTDSLHRSAVQSHPCDSSSLRGYAPALPAFWPYSAAHFPGYSHLPSPQSASGSLGAVCWLVSLEESDRVTQPRMPRGRAGRPPQGAPRTGQRCAAQCRRLRPQQWQKLRNPRCACVEVVSSWCRAGFFLSRVARIRSL